MTHKMLILADTVVDPITRFINSSDSDTMIETSIGPYNQINTLIMDEHHSIWNDRSTILTVWSTPQRLIPAFNNLYLMEEVSVHDILDEVNFFADSIIKASSRKNLIFVISWSLPPHFRWNQSITTQYNKGISNVLMQMNLQLAKSFQNYKNIVILDSQYWYTALQESSYDPKMYALGKINYSRNFFRLAATEIRRAIESLHGQYKKLIICDLDNTLWGGIIGDDGIEGIKLGGMDPVGESFSLFQKELLRLKNQGILLAISSKNDYSTAMNMIEAHPEMVLKKSDFVSFQINWNDKAENIASIVSSLNLGMQSVVFLDDNPVERDRVKNAHPEITVPDLPEDVTQYPSFLSQLNLFDVPTITNEDRDRANQYIVEKSRQKALVESQSKESWLQSLDITLTAETLSKTNLTRATQLLNKTNQFNMATRRYTEQELWSFSQEDDVSIYTYRIHDKFGDSGLTGLVSLKFFESRVEVIDFIMSCRIMGRNIEEAILYHATRTGNAGMRPIFAKYKQTDRNQPFFDFIKSKYNNVEEGILDFQKIVLPNHITLLRGNQS